MAYYEHLAILPNDEVKCTLCEEIINDTNLLREAHLHSRRHRELYMKTMMLTNNIIMGTSDLICCICNIKVYELLNHIQCPEHQSKVTAIKKLVRSDGDFITLPDKKNPCAYCVLCDKGVEFKSNSIEDHIISTTHKIAKAMALQPLNGIFSVEGSDKYLWCKVCQIFFDNYIEIIFHHVQESEHVTKIGKILRLIDGQNIEIEKYLQNLKQDKVYCKTCRMEVPCCVDNLQSHINGKKHKDRSS